MDLIYSLQSYELPSLDQVGGKALSLMQMTGAGMPVPPGFVLAVDFFEPWSEHLKQSPAWPALLTADAAEIGEAARALQAAGSRLRFSVHQKDALDASLKTFREDNPRVLFAVRSSSPEEDLEGASFAGVYVTSLGVSEESLEAAILHSYISIFDERVFLYKLEHGLRIDQPRIAVIIEGQVNADSAGVAFSLNPLNNCFDEALINANHGLGESVVTGGIDPDVFIVDKVHHQILETREGKKQAVIILDGQGGTRMSPRPGQPGLCLSSNQVMEVTGLLERVESYYRKPIDIEWAFSGGRLFLLQARPITTYLPLPEEMVTAPGEPKHLYANSTLIEQGMQEPLSVLGTDFLGYVLKQVSGAFAKDGIGPGGMTFTAGGGYYMDLSYSLKMGMRNAAFAPGNFGDPRILSILDNIDMKQYLSVDIPPKLKKSQIKLLFTALPMVRSVLKAYLRPTVILRDYQAALPQELQRFEMFSGDGRSLQTQAVELTELLQFFYGDYGIPMILAGQFAQWRIKNLFKNETIEVQDHLRNLGISLPGNKTAEMGESMYSLASSSEIDRYNEAAEFLSDLEAKKLTPEFTQAWERFLSEFGMRCPGEIDPATPRPQENPAVIFDQLKNMSLAARERAGSCSIFEEARDKREASHRALVAIASQKGKKRAQTLEKYYHTWLAIGGYRETPKHYVIKVIGLFRRQALAIAQIFCNQGRLDRPEQIFDLTIADIDRATADPTLDLRTLAMERTVLFHKIKKSRLAARIIDSRGKIYYPPREATSDGELRGVPISPGVVRGRVKVFHYAGEKKLLPGEILVARATDPGWTPLFINAKGILLEIGGVLQHGAVVAREYGIPCVSGLDDITSMLSDGQWVEVDGSHGIVRMINDASDC